MSEPDKCQVWSPKGFSSDEKSDTTMITVASSEGSLFAIPKAHLCVFSPVFRDMLSAVSRRWSARALDGIH